MSTYEQGSPGAAGGAGLTAGWLKLAEINFLPEDAVFSGADTDHTLTTGEVFQQNTTAGVTFDGSTGLSNNGVGSLRWAFRANKINAGSSVDFSAYDRIAAVFQFSCPDPCTSSDDFVLGVGYHPTINNDTGSTHIAAFCDSRLKAQGRSAGVVHAGVLPVWNLVKTGMTSPTRIAVIAHGGGGSLHIDDSATGAAVDPDDLLNYGGGSGGPLPAGGLGMFSADAADNYVWYNGVASTAKLITNISVWGANLAN